MIGGGDQCCRGLLDRQIPAGVQQVEAIEARQEPQQVGGLVGGDIGTQRLLVSQTLSGVGQGLGRRFRPAAVTGCPPVVE